MANHGWIGRRTRESDAKLIISVPTTFSVARVLETLDAERVAVGAAMGFNCMTAREWLYVAYDAAGKTLFDAIHANTGYDNIKSPPHLNHRLSEDVPMSLVPIASIGRLLDVPCHGSHYLLRRFATRM